MTKKAIYGIIIGLLIIIASGVIFFVNQSIQAEAERKRGEERAEAFMKQQQKGLDALIKKGLPKK